MYKHSIVRLSMIASIAIVYVFLPILGLLKAYATDSNQWYWLCSTWALPIVMCILIPIIDSYLVRRIVKKMVDEIKLTIAK